MRREEVAALAVAGLGIALWARALGTVVQPDMRAKPGPPIPAWHPGQVTGGTWDHPGYPWRAPAAPGQVKSRHRYPAGCGGEVTVIVRHGMPGFAKGPPQDATWIARHPSTQAW